MRVARQRGARFVWDYLTQIVWFDLRYGTDTLRRKPVTPTSEVGADAVHYVASFTSVVRQALRAVEGLYGERFASAQFVDLGCGKGKAILLYELLYRGAAHPPALGVEYDPELVAIANRNLRKIEPAGPGAVVVCDDAGRLLVHASRAPLILYMYNPFGRQTLERVLQTLPSVEHVLIYVDPAHLETLLEHGYTVVEEHRGRWRADTWLVARRTEAPAAS